MDKKNTITQTQQKCFGGKVIVYKENGSKLYDEISVADAHPAGKDLRKSTIY